MERKIQRHLQSFSQNITGIKTFDINLQCPFQPDEIKIKQVAYNEPAPVTTSMYALHCDTLLPTSALTAFLQPCLHFVGVSFTVTNFANGTYTFQVRQNGALSATAAGIINLTLEFRKYH